MTDHQEHRETEQEFSYWSKHRLFLMVGIAITIALALVSVSMALYSSSGTAQIDLSRPGYKAVSSQAVTTDPSFENYSAFGELTEAAVKEFETLYDKQATKAKAVDAFGGDPLDPLTLEISAPAND